MPQLVGSDPPTKPDKRLKVVQRIAQYGISNEGW